MLGKRTFNPKRRICPPDRVEGILSGLPKAPGLPRYTGNPEHKRNPGDYGLHPPGSPRPGKPLCDTVGIFTRAEASRLLSLGLERGVFSEQLREGWPQNVWALTDSGEPLEAQLEGHGAYHAYPMPDSDPFREKVITRWHQS